MIILDLLFPQQTVQSQVVWLKFEVRVFPYMSLLYPRRPAQTLSLYYFPGRLQAAWEEA